jgi:hypothetical protein
VEKPDTFRETARNLGNPSTKRNRSLIKRRLKISPKLSEISTPILETLYSKPSSKRVFRKGLHRA